MPYLFSLAQQYAYATSYTASTHPSLPNYLSIAGGSTFGVADDAAPAYHPIAGDSVFDQAIAQGKTAATYADGMTSNCMLSNTGRYAVKHNPHAYFSGTTQRANCAATDVPAGTPTTGELHNAIAAGALPNVGMLVPDLCNDAHDCSLSVADAYLQTWLPSILAGPDFTSGRLAIVITADEDDSTQNNTVLTVVLHPSEHGRVVTTPLSHYSLTGFYDSVLGAPALRNAATAPSFRTAFGL